MAGEQDALHDWHRLFGLLLTDFFTGSPFLVEVERDMSEQQQLLDVVIVRCGRGRFTERLPDGLENLAAHIQRFARTGGFRPKRLPAAFTAHEWDAAATLSEVSGGGFGHAVHLDGL